jgi:hypothetical protein
MKGRPCGRPFFLSCVPEDRSQNISRMKPSLTLLLLTAAVAPTAAAAQRTGIVAGVVIDSQHGGGLRGAEITLSGIPDVAVTDSVGRFHFDSVTPGQKQLGVFHPLLDSLGISLGSKPFTLGLDSAGIIVLAIPSANTLVRELCGLRPRDKLSGLLMGRITDPETGAPVAGSRVAARWTSYEVKGRKTLQELPKAVVAETNQTGVFRLCGIPIDRTVGMQAVRDGIASPDLQIVIGGVPIIIADIAIRSSGSRAVGRVVGRAVDSAGRAVAGAYVALDGLGLSTMTDWNGEFSLDSVAPGTQIVLLRKIGFSPMAVPIFVSVKPPQMISYEMSKAVPILDRISVVAKGDAGLVRVGFTERQKTALGNFMTQDQIEKEKPTRLSEVLRRIPGLTLDGSKGRGYVKATRDPRSTAERACIRMFIDGTEWMMVSEGYVDDAIPPSRVGAIEVFHPLDVPPEYSIMTNCTTILLWSKHKLRTR